ncbi:MAG: hypothetical protein AAF215_05585 [Cyanobacteria bacterium P01_A01_bin.123]
MNANWTHPSPRSGWKGWLDRFVGPGATPSELLVQVAPSLIAGVAAPAYALTLPVQWSSLQLGLMALFGFDLVGGILTNATASAKRWYHRPGQGWRQHLGFISIHLIHILLVVLLFRGADWGFFWSVSGYLLGASILILQSPLYLQRPVALGLYGLALVGDRYLFVPTPGLEWFLPLFFLKLLVSHLLYEMPYRPGATRDAL